DGSGAGRFREGGGSGTGVVQGRDRLTDRRVPAAGPSSPGATRRVSGAETFMCREVSGVGESLSMGAEPPASSMALRCEPSRWPRRDSVPLGRAWIGEQAEWRSAILVLRVGRLVSPLTFGPLPNGLVNLRIVVDVDDHDHLGVVKEQPDTAIPVLDLVRGWHALGLEQLPHPGFALDLLRERCHARKHAPEPCNGTRRACANAAAKVQQKCEGRIG